MYFYSVLDSEPRNNKSLIRLFEHNGSSVASQEKLDLMHVPRRELLLREKKDKWLFGWKISASVLLLLAILQNLSSDTTLLADTPCYTGQSGNPKTDIDK